MKVLKLLKRYYKLTGQPLNGSGILAFKKQYHNLNHIEKGLFGKNLLKYIEHIVDNKEKVAVK